MCCTLHCLYSPKFINWPNLVYVCVLGFRGWGARHNDQLDVEKAMECVKNAVSILGQPIVDSTGAKAIPVLCIHIHLLLIYVLCFVNDMPINHQNFLEVLKLLFFISAFFLNDVLEESDLPKR